MKKILFSTFALLLCLTLFACGNQSADIRQAYINAGYVELTDLSIFSEMTSHQSVEETLAFTPEEGAYDKLAIFMFSSVDALKTAIYENSTFVNHIEGLSGSTPDELYNNAVQSGYVNKNYLLMPISMSPVKKAEFIRIFSSVNL